MDELKALLLKEANYLSSRLMLLTSLMGLLGFMCHVGGNSGAWEVAFGIFFFGGLIASVVVMFAEFDSERR